MSEEHKQTWWDKEIKSQFEEFKSWVGPPSANSKVFIRDFIIKKGYESVIDIGCGMCDDYFRYKVIPIKWLGIEGSKFLYDNSQELEIPVLNREGHATGLSDNHSDVAYSRHVLEHQKNYKPILSEMIRIGSKVVIHIFFIPPRDKEIINYNSNNNLYHNTYKRSELEDWVKSQEKVKDLAWVPINKTEEALIINLKE